MGDADDARIVAARYELQFYQHSVSTGCINRRGMAGPSPSIPVPLVASLLGRYLLPVVGSTRGNRVPRKIPARIPNRINSSGAGCFKAEMGII